MNAECGMGTSFAAEVRRQELRDWRELRERAALDRYWHAFNLWDEKIRGETEK